MIEGQHPQVVNDDLVAEFGRVLARFHNATQQLDIVGSSWLSEPTISEEIAAVDDRTVRLRLQQMRDDVLHLYDAGLPVANIHGDICASNVLAESGRITAVFDLETTEKTLRVLDMCKRSFVPGPDLERCALIRTTRMLSVTVSVEVVGVDTRDSDGSAVFGSVARAATTVIVECGGKTRSVARGAIAAHVGVGAALHIRNHDAID